MKTALTTALAFTAMTTAPAWSQVSADAEAEASVSAQTSDVVEEVAETGYAIGETTTDAMQAGIKAIGGIVEDGYGEASNLSAELDAAITNDAEVYTADGELIGTVTRTDASGEYAIVDLDGEMEGADARPIENIAVRLQDMIVGNDGFMIAMSEAQLKAEINTSARVRLDG